MLDEPTDLPEGAEVEIVVIDDKLSADESAALHAALHASLDGALDDSEAERGGRARKPSAEAERGMDAARYLRQYFARREDAAADAMTPNERDALERALERSIAQADAGGLVEADDVLAELQRP